MVKKKDISKITIDDMRRLSDEEKKGLRSDRLRWLKQQRDKDKKEILDEQNRETSRIYYWVNKLKKDMIKKE